MQTIACKLSCKPSCKPHASHKLSSPMRILVPFQTWPIFRERALAVSHSLRGADNRLRSPGSITGAMSARRSLPERTTIEPCAPANSPDRPRHRGWSKKSAHRKYCRLRLRLRPWLSTRLSAHAGPRRLCPRHDKNQHGICAGLATCPPINRKCKDGSKWAREQVRLHGARLPAAVVVPAPRVR